MAQQPVEFLLAVPVDQNILGTTTKVILRRTVKGIVPEGFELEGTRSSSPHQSLAGFGVSSEYK